MKARATAGPEVDLSRRAALVFMIAILLIVFGFGAGRLDWDGIDTDELATLSGIGVFGGIESSLQVMELVQQQNANHVPLYFYLCAFWAKLAGIGQFQLRLLSLLLGALSIAGLYRLAADLLDRRAGLVAALLMGANALVFTELHDMRMYSLLLLLTAAHFWLYWQLAIKGRGGRIRWIFFIISCSAIFYTHNLAAAWFAGLGLYHLLFVPRSRQWWRILLAWALGFALFLPYFQQISQSMAFMARNPLPYPKLSALELIMAVGLDAVNYFELLWLPLLIGIALIIRRQRGGIAPRLLLIGLLIFAALTAIDAVIETIDFTRTRYFLIMWPPLMIGLSAALLSLPRPRLTLPLFLLLYAAAGLRLEYADVALDYPFRVPGARTLSYPPLHRYVRGLHGVVGEDEFLIGFRQSGGIYINHTKFAGDFFDYYIVEQLGIDGLFLHANLKRYRLERDVRGILRGHPYVILAHDPGDLPWNYAKTHEIISETYLPCTVFVDDPDLHIQRYAHPLLGCERKPASIMYDNGIRLIDQAARFDPERQIIQALLWWDLPRADMLDQFNFSLQIITPNWQNLRHVDHHLHGEFLPWNVSALSTADLPPGKYRLMLILYERESERKVTGLAGGAAEPAAILPIMNLELRD